MYELKVYSYFAAAHHLRNYGGKCEQLHGHNWKVEVFIEADELDNVGLVIDFKEIKAMLGEVLSTLDHHNLNDLPMFKEKNPSSENVAGWIYQKISSLLSCRNIHLSKISVWESETCCASYISKKPKED